VRNVPRASASWRRDGFDAARLATFVTTGIAVGAIALVWVGHRRVNRARLEVTPLGIGDASSWTRLRTGRDIQVRCARYTGA
jgi:hypothetical protein